MILYKYQVIKNLNKYNIINSLYNILPPCPPEALLRVLKRPRAADILPTIVFCNRSATCCFVGHFLDSNGISNVVVHGNMPQKVGFYW